MIVVVHINIFIGFTSRLQVNGIFTLFVKKKDAGSTDEDAARLLRLQEIGELESEFESRGKNGRSTENELTSGKEQEVGEDDSAAEGQIEDRRGVRRCWT